MSIPVTVEYLGDGAGWYASSHLTRGCWGYGDTKDAALDDYADALPDWVHVASEHGAGIPFQLDETFSGRTTKEGDEG